ncbi:MAG: two-component sensor histidine kinase, partial [Erysipelotrichaceae bacterium]|nr:two-component sensor histidine kinase [Erysipelotrichaceae bacterium]
MTKKIFKSVFFSTLVILAASLALILGALNRYFMSLEETQLTSQAQLAAAGVETSGMDYLNSLPSSDEYRITWIAA